MRPSGWNGAAGSGLVLYAKRGSARRCCCVAMKPASPSGARSATPGPPTGEQPEVPTSGKRKGYKVFGLIDSFSGQFFYNTHEGRLNAASSAAFLRDVLAQTRRHVIVIHDGARYHTSRAMQQFFKAHAARLTIEQWPSYSPDFNPIEPLWKKVKKEATHLQYFPDFSQLQTEVDRALRHFAHTPSAITVLRARYCETLGAKAA